MARKAEVEIPLGRGGWEAFQPSDGLLSYIGTIESNIMREHWRHKDDVRATHQLMRSDIASLSSRIHPQNLEVVVRKSLEATAVAARHDEQIRNMQGRLATLEDFGMAKYEGSKADIKTDTKMAKAKGVSLKAWEKTPADKAKDKAGQKMMSKGKR